MVVEVAIDEAHAKCGSGIYSEKGTIHG